MVWYGLGKWALGSGRCGRIGFTCGSSLRSISRSRRQRRVDGRRLKLPMPSSPNRRIHTIAVVAVFAAAAGILAFVILRPGVTAQRPLGVVQPTEIKIAPEISGRLLRFAVAPGQSVRKGDTLAELSNPELEAGLGLAKAQLGQARALRDRVYAGPRQEQVDALARD